MRHIHHSHPGPISFRNAAVFLFVSIVCSCLIFLQIHLLALRHEAAGILDAQDDAIVDKLTAFSSPAVRERPKQTHATHVRKVDEPIAAEVPQEPEDESDSTVPYYLQGKTEYRKKAFHNTKTYENLLTEENKVIGEDVETWILPNQLSTPVRNHESIVLEHNGRQTIVNVLGRYSRTVQWMDLFTGEQQNYTTQGVDPSGNPLNDLNHVYSVIVDSLDGTTKEIWLPCGFHNDTVNEEWSSDYARILDVKTMKIRVGPKLPFAGGACVALPIEVDGPGTPPHICSFGGTRGNHDKGFFLPYTACYDRTREKWHHPFGKLPYGFDHGSIAHVPPGICGPSDPGRLLIFNYRTQAYGTQSTAMLAFDLPANGWTEDELNKSDPEKPGPWYVYANITYNKEDPAKDVNAPRDASGTVVANGGRNVINFGGVHYKYPTEEDRKRGVRRQRWHYQFSMIRMLDVCEKTWTKIGDLGLQLFAVQSGASSELNVAFSCGGNAIYQKDGNSPWCIATRFPNVTLQNFRTAARTNFAPDFEPGGDVQIA